MVLIQALVNGLLIGAVWGVLGLGKQIVLGVIHFVNFAHGHLVLLGMYLTLFAWITTGADPFLLLPVVAIAMVILAFILDRLLVRRLIKLGERSQMIATIALALVIENAALLIAGPQPRTLQNSWSDKAVQLGGVYLNAGRLMGLAIAILAFVVTWWIITKTPLGVMIRATSQNRAAAQYMGIDIGRVYAYAFALSVALAGVVGSLYVVSTPVDPSTAWTFLILMFIVPVLGGLGSIAGTFLAGLIVGVLQLLSTTYFDIQLQDALVYGVFVLFLVVRPQGLFGRAADQRQVSV
ncbi:branched-chain amino acid ABC transporter permease [Nocardioides sp. KR10-350]|uniref:branched-chain amino acid ABC transporter permease n=1 Tax=Nocardioides cheoyonin TaxID=3156615 RepID=UPI0032B437E7